MLLPLETAFSRFASLMFAAFSPDGKQVAFVRENNLYVQALESLKITALTTASVENAMVIAM